MCTTVFLNVTVTYISTCFHHQIKIQLINKVQVYQNHTGYTVGQSQGIVSLGKPSCSMQ